MDEDIPYIPPQLVQWLEKAFPNELPSNLLTMTDRELGAVAGEQRLLTFLKARLAAQEEPHLP